MKNVLAFSASMSGNSINHRLVELAVSKLTTSNVKLIRLSDHDAPTYRKELESEAGIPVQIQKLRKLFDQADAFIISAPEYNSSIPAGFKNTIDWLSRMECKVFQDKTVLLMAASPGGRGGRSVLDHLSSIIPFWGAKLIGPFSFPKFNENFRDGKISEPELDAKLSSMITEFERSLG